MEESGECCVDLAQSWLLPLSIHDRNQLEEVSSLLRSFSEKLAQECQVDQGFGVADLDDRSSSIVNSYFPDMNGIDEALCKHGGGFEDIDHASSVDSLSRESRASIVGNFKSIISERLVCLYELFDNSLEVRKLSERRNLLEKTTESLFSDRRPVHLRRRIYSSIPALKPDSVEYSLKKGMVLNICLQQQWHKGLLLDWKFDQSWPQFRLLKVKIVVSEVSKVIWIEANSDNVKFEQDLHDDAMKQCTDANFRDRYHWPHSSWTELGAKSPEPVIKSKGNGVPTVSCALSPTGDNANDVSHSDYILNHLFDFPAKTLEVIRPYLEFRYPSLIAKRRVLVLAPIGQEPQLRLDPRLLAKSPSLPSRKRCFGEVEV